MIATEEEVQQMSFASEESLSSHLNLHWWDGGTEFSLIARSDGKVSIRADESEIEVDRKCFIAFAGMIQSIPR